MLVYLLVKAIDVYSLIVLAAVILSWIPSARGTVVAQWIARVTEPVLERIRSVLPPMGGIDISPMILLLGLRLLSGLLVSLLY